MAKKYTDIMLENASVNRCESEKRICTSIIATGQADVNPFHSKNGESRCLDMVSDAITHGE